MIVMNEWRKEIEITFPIIRYHPLIVHRDGVKIRKTHTLLDAPMRIGGSPDGSDYLRHGGTGLSRNSEYPSKSAVLPGGILDASGRHIPILDIDAPENKPNVIINIISVFIAEVRTFRYKQSFGEPEQLKLEEFKDRLIKLGKEERKMPRPTKKILAAKSFYEVMEAECDPEITKAYYKTVWVKNWIDHKA